MVSYIFHETYTPLHGDYGVLSGISNAIVFCSYVNLDSVYRPLTVSCPSEYTPWYDESAF